MEERDASKVGLAAWDSGVTHFSGKDDIARHADKLAENTFDVTIPFVKQGSGTVDFFTDVADVDLGYPDWDPLKVLIQACQDRGVKVHPCFCVFPEGEQSRLLRAHPEFTGVYESDVRWAGMGNPELQGRWACGCIPEVQDYLFSLYEDLALRYRPAGLHLDFIRTGGLCRCDFCKKEMRASGVDIETVEFRDPAYELWTEWRVSRIADFVRRVHALTTREGMELSAAVFRDYPECIRFQAQDWAGWAEEGIVDYLFEMNYTNSIRLAVLRTLAHVAQVKGKVPLWQGLGKRSSMSVLSTEVLKKQVRGVLEAGADGIVIFTYPALTPEDLAFLRQLRRP